MRKATQVLSMAALLSLVVSPIAVYLGSMELSTCKHVMFAATLVWFAATPLWMGRPSQ